MASASRTACTASSSTTADDVEASRAAATAQVAALLADPPAWLHTEYNHEPSPTPLDFAKQHPRGSPRAGKLAWKWICSVKGPDGSPYGGDTYRVLVRFPLGYPLLPPRLHALSILHHIEVELRDPNEGKLDDLFYEMLIARCGIDAASVEAALRVPVVPETIGRKRPPSLAKRPKLRFGVGDRVECNAGSWMAGSVVALWYSEPGWPTSRVAPYQVELDDGRLIYAPADAERLIRAEPGSMLADILSGEASGDAAADVAAGAGSAAAGEEDEEGEEGEEEAEPAEQEETAPDEPGEGSGGASEQAAPSASSSSSSSSSVSSAAAAAVLGARFELRAALELFGSMLAAPLEPQPTAQEAAAWASVAERHAEALTTAVEYRATALHPELFGAPQPSWFAPSFAAALAAADPPAALRALAEEVAPGVYAFDMLSEAFCAKLLAELERYEASGLPVVRPNSMNNYGVVLNSVGLEKTMDRLQRLAVAPLASRLFPLHGGDADHHHTFMVQYKHGEDLGLDMHTDASDVTLNVCLGKDFTGAGLTFCGVRGGGGGGTGAGGTGGAAGSAGAAGAAGAAGGGGERRFSYRHAHVKGRAVMHLGAHRHGADDLSSGERYNLIMWCKSSSHRLTADFATKYQRAPDSDSTRGPPDLVCLSYTHDDDYEDYLELAPAKRAKREQSRRGG